MTPREAAKIYKESENLGKFVGSWTDHEALNVIKASVIGLLLTEMPVQDNLQLSVSSFTQKDQDVERFDFKMIVQHKEPDKVSAFLQMVFLPENTVEESSSDLECESFSTVIQRHIEFSYKTQSLGSYAHGIFFAVSLLEKSNYKFIHYQIESDKQIDSTDPSGKIWFFFTNPEAHYKLIMLAYDHQVWLDDETYLNNYLS